jgi:fructokinase
MNNTIYCIGEVVYDIIFRDDQPLAASAGGAMLNSAVSLGRSGVPVSFIGECGTDRAGEMIADFLQKNSVNTNFLQRPDNTQTIISLAFLNKKKEASYSFYRSEPGSFERINPEFRNGDFLLFGSYYSVSEANGSGVLKTVRHAAEKGAILYYDPNFRKPHLNQLKTIRPLIKRNIRISDIIRGSNEDFQLVFGTGSAKETWEMDCFRGNKVLIYTSGEKEVEVFTEEFYRKYPVPEIKPVSTIGAGDTFNAGIIKAITEKDNLKTLLKDPGSWDYIIKNGILFARAACMSYENYIPEGFVS